jgi:hypothetical protein
VRPADKLQVKAAQIPPLVERGRFKQDPMKRGHGALYLYRPLPAGAKPLHGSQRGRRTGKCRLHRRINCSPSLAVRSALFGMTLNFCGFVLRGWGGTHTLIEVVASADDRLAAAEKPAHLVRQLGSLCLLQPTCASGHIS